MGDPHVAERNRRSASVERTACIELTAQAEDRRPFLRHSTSSSTGSARCCVHAQLARTSAHGRDRHRTRRCPHRSLAWRSCRLQVLVLDDFLLAPLKDAERRDLFEILEDRYDLSSTVITSQLPTETSGTPPSATQASPTPSATGSCIMATS